jgi:CDP-paratose synthetase
MHMGISGASGFLGGHLCRAMVAAGHRVTALVRRASSRDRLPAIECLEVDDPRAVDKFEWSAMGALIHAATSYGRGGASSASMLRDNVLFPLTLLERLPSGAALINTDSFFSKPSCVSEYLGPYTLCKKQLLEWLTLEDTRVIVNMRLEHLYGPGDSMDKFIPGLVEKLLDHTRRVELTGGTQERDFVYVEDVVSAYGAVVSRLPSFSTGLTEIEVGRGETTTVRAFVELAKSVSASTSVLAFGALQMKTGEIESSCADTDALRELGWEPRWSLEEGLRECIEDVRGSRKLR